MSDEPDPARLAALEARLAQAKGEAASATEAERSFSQGEVAWRMVIELVTGMGLGLAIGYGLDALFGTMPILLVIFALFGFAAGVRTMLGTARQLAADQAAKAAGQPDRTKGQ
ncbi:MAG: F0F1 ATP synthase subunit I [Rhodobacteraceae bacterium CG2_30_10_405]|nr:AtpZ/AtpI family protein [Rhodobacterales bacterium]NCO17544.1 AtpZ/AtpI family protein [Alphaproteobacteria bacterium]OIQ07125.1 MAG: F0F1 ATP synthase subunit I [Rhodobacteraceae bacterium CG2_30_10_405]